MKHMHAVAILIVALLSPSVAWSSEGEPIFAGVWSQKEPGGVGSLFYDQSWEGLVSHRKEFGQKEYLANVEAYRHDGQWRYAALWRVGPGNGALYFQPWDDFAKTWNDLKKTQDLIDLEIVQTDNGLKYLGVWRHKQGRDRGEGAFLINLTWEELVARWKELGTNQYLADVETYVSGGKRLFAGIWRRGGGNGALNWMTDWKAFAEIKRSNNPYQELLDFEMFQTEDGEWNFLGVWRVSDRAGPLHASTSDTKFQPLTAPQFVDQWEKLQQTRTLVDIEVAVPYWPDIDRVEYLGNFPKHRQSGWSNNLQGVASDVHAWFFTQEKALWKFPISHDLNEKVTGAELGRGILKVGIPQPLIDKTFDHFGDLDHYLGYLFIPVEGDGEEKVVAVFKASNLAHVASAPLILSNGRRQPRAGWVAIHPVSGLLYTSDNTIDGDRPIFIYKFDLEQLKQGKFKLEHRDSLFLRDKDGHKMGIKPYLQGGVFSSDGNTLFLSNGKYATPQEDSGLWLFDARTGKKLMKSAQSGGFEYTFHTKSKLEEPEGITFVDLDQRKAPGIPGGQLHAILLDNDAGSADEFYFKHYRIHYDRKP
jgi:hypothetical protein